MARFRVAVVIPVFNQWALTKDCLCSLREHTPEEDVQVIVVDNGSTDETPEQCGPLGAAVFGPRFEYVRLEANINFGPACNLGASRSDADYLFFLNNDTILTPGWLPPLVQALAADSNLGAVGPLLLYPDSDRVQHLGVTFTPNSHVSHLYHYFPRTHPVVGRKRDLQAITGAALMLSSTTFEMVGGFWPEYRNGYEDLDLCRQIRLLGRTLRCEPQSWIYHLTSQTPGRFAHEDHNGRILMERCAGGFQPDLHVWAAADGYRLRLEDDLSPNLVWIGSEGELDALPLDRLWSAVLAEPLWEDGYRRLLQVFFQRRMWAEALDVLRLQQCFFASRGIVLDMAKVATRMGDQELAEQCRQALAKVHAALAARDLYQKFLLIQQRAAAENDEILIAACREWDVLYAKRV